MEAAIGRATCVLKCDGTRVESVNMETAGKHLKLNYAEPKNQAVF